MIKIRAFLGVLALVSFGSFAGGHQESLTVLSSSTDSTAKVTCYPGGSFFALKKNEHDEIWYEQEGNDGRVERKLFNKLPKEGFAATVKYLNLLECPSVAQGSHLRLIVTRNKEDVGQTDIPQFSKPFPSISQIIYYDGKLRIKHNSFGGSFDFGYKVNNTRYIRQKSVSAYETKSDWYEVEVRDPVTLKSDVVTIKTSTGSLDFPFSRWVRRKVVFPIYDHDSSSQYVLNGQIIESGDEIYLPSDMPLTLYKDNRPYFMGINWNGDEGELYIDESSTMEAICAEVCLAGSREAIQDILELANLEAVKDKIKEGLSSQGHQSAIYQIVIEDINYNTLKGIPGMRESEFLDTIEASKKAFLPAEGIKTNTLSIYPEGDFIRVTNRSAIPISVTKTSDLTGPCEGLDNPHNSGTVISGANTFIELGYNSIFPKNSTMIKIDSPTEGVNVITPGESTNLYWNGTVSEAVETYGKESCKNISSTKKRLKSSMASATGKRAIKAILLSIDAALKHSNTDCIIDYSSSINTDCSGTVLTGSGSSRLNINSHRYRSSLFDIRLASDVLDAALNFEEDKLLHTIAYISASLTKLTVDAIDRVEWYSNSSNIDAATGRPKLPTNLAQALEFSGFIGCAALEFVTQGQQYASKASGGAYSSGGSIDWKKLGSEALFSVSSSTIDCSLSTSVALIRDTLTASLDFIAFDVYGLTQDHIEEMDSVVLATLPRFEPKMKEVINYTFDRLSPTLWYVGENLDGAYLKVILPDGSEVLSNIKRSGGKFYSLIDKSQLEGVSGSDVLQVKMLDFSGNQIAEHEARFITTNISAQLVQASIYFTLSGSIADTPVQFKITELNTKGNKVGAPTVSQVFDGGGRYLWGGGREYFMSVNHHESAPDRLPTGVSSLNKAQTIKTDASGKYALRAGKYAVEYRDASSNDGSWTRLKDLTVSGNVFDVLLCAKENLDYKFNYSTGGGKYNTSVSNAWEGHVRKNTCKLIGEDELLDGLPMYGRTFAYSMTVRAPNLDQSYPESGDEKIDIDLGTVRFRPRGFSYGTDGYPYDREIEIKYHDARVDWHKRVFTDIGGARRAVPNGQYVLKGE